MFRSIHYLRGVAATSVICFHATHGQVPVAAAGVDVFFVISGFVIFTSTAGRAFRPAAYCWRRFVRIMPLWWIALAVWAAVMIPLDLVPAPDTRDASLSALLIPHERYDGEFGPYLGPGWTLSYEVLFYGVFGAAMWIGNWRLGVLLLIAASLGVGILVLEFVAGVLLAWAIQAGIRPSPWLAILGLALFLIPISGHRAVVWGIPAALVIAGVIGMELRGLLSQSRLLGLLGDASYSLYLFNLVPIWTSVFWLPQLPELPSMVVLAVSGVSFGVIVHLSVERPMLRALRPLPATIRRLGPSV